MNRRGFLATMLAAGMAPVIVKAANIMPVFMRRESGLLVRASLDGGSTFVGNTLLTPAMITREALMILEKNLVLASRVNEKFDRKFGDWKLLNKVFDA